MYMIVLDHAGRRTHHVVEASEEGDVGEPHQLGVVNAKTDKTRNYIFCHFSWIFCQFYLNGSTM